MTQTNILTENYRKAIICINAFFLFSCSSNIPLEFFYDDELVEAPTRQLHLKIFNEEVSCDDYLSAPHTSELFSEFLVKEIRTGYPVITATLEPEAFTAGKLFTFGVEAYDKDKISVARGCETQVGGEFDEISLQLFGLAKCRLTPREIDLALVVDTSSRSLARDPRLTHIKMIREIMLEESLFSTWTIMSTAPTPRVWVSKSSSLEKAREAFGQIEETYTESDSAHFDGVVQASRLLRSESLCGRVPAMFIFTGGIDRNSDLTWQNARLGLEGSLIDPEDNIFTVGLTLEENAFGEFLDFIPQNSGNAYLAQYTEFLEAQLLEVREQLAALVPNP
ncbi:MAG: hypothetical protein VYC39_03515 [Myxococcota bacterium]|nr:hypothetical protein [Myxococcota bacterium]